jgi:uncharacterized membrane protein HdeD (DUF308 family)
MIEEIVMNSWIDKELDVRAVQQLKESSGWFFALGIGLVILGTLALIYSVAATLFSIIYLGLFLLLFGIFEAVKSFKVRHWGNFFLHLALSFLYVVAGVFIIRDPALSAVALTLLIATCFIIGGLLKLFFSFSKQSPHRSWLAFDGALNLLLGFLIYSQWPLSGLWVIGMLVGINIAVTGWTWIMLSSAVKEL